MGILVLSTYAETNNAVSLLASGARGVGYLLKDRVASGPSLRDALSRLVQGECVIDPEIIERLLTRKQGNPALSTLAPRDREVLQLMAEGRSNASIARTLFLSERTIETYVATIFDKLGLSADAETNRRVQAVIAWLRTQ